LRAVNSERIFDDNLQLILSQLNNEGGYDLVIGIPFFRESPHLPELLQLVDKILCKLIGKRYLIVCAGDQYCNETLSTIQGLQLENPHMEY
jgi:hypothetical protein